MIGLSGCARPAAPPDLKPVSGTVRTASGELFTTGGIIEFRHTTDLSKRSTSPIDEQGRFSLFTGDAQMRFPGAYAGEYRVSAYRKGDFTQLDAAELVSIPPEGRTDLEIVVSEASP